MQEKEQEFSFKSLFVPLTTFKAIHIIIIVGVLVYGNALFNGFVGDDESIVVNNPFIRSILNIPNFFSGSTSFGGDINILQGYYRPVMFSFYSFLFMVSGSQPFMFHIFQVFMHILNAIIIFFIFRYYFKPGIAIILVLLFLSHPINSETVSYISNLQDILFFFFGSLALYLHLRLKNSFTKGLGVMSLLLLSLLSKETGFLFIAAIIFHEFYFHKNYIKKTILINFITISIYLFLRVLTANVSLHKNTFSPIMNLPLMERLLNVPSIFLYYLKTFFFPLPLATSQHWIISFQNIFQFYFALFFQVAILLTLMLVGINIKNKHKEYYKLYLFFSLWFLIGIFFHSQILFALDFTVADRWFYFPMIGFLGILGIISQIYIIKYKKLFITVVIIILCILSIQTMMRNADFKDNYSLYSHDIKYSKNSSLLESGLGNELLKLGRYEEAKMHALRAVQLDPKGYMNWNNLGVYYERTGKLKEAEAAYITAIKNGNNPVAYHNYAFFLFIYDKPEKTEAFIKKSIDMFPRDGFLWQLYAFIEHSLKKNDQAIFAAKQALLYNPTKLNYIIYNRLVQHLSLDVKPISTKDGNVLQVCPPSCE